MPAPQIKLPEGSRYVQSGYIDGNSGKTDLVRRIRNLIKTLRNDDVQPDANEWPGLASVSETLVKDYLDHSDKEVRLHTVMACVEILMIYAPEVPWTDDDLLAVFQHMTRQLGNLAHTHDAKNHPSYTHYSTMLENVAEVRIGCILVDMAQHENQKAQDMLLEFIHTLLHCVHHEHSSKIVELVQQAISFSLEEYHPTQGVPVPIEILDELLKCVGQGPTQMVLAPQAGPKRSKRSKKLPQLQVPNPSFLVAAGVIRKLHNKMASPISNLLNGLLQNQAHYVDRSAIQCITESCQDAQQGENEVYEIIFQLHRVAPPLLTTVMGALDLQSPYAKQRYEVTKLLGRLFCEKKFAAQYAACFREWLRRRHDVEVEIRTLVVRQCLGIVKSNGEKEADMAVEALEDLVMDVALEVRSEAIRLITDWAYRVALSSPTTVLLRAVGERVRSRHKQERQDALVGLSFVYNKQWLVPHLEGVVEGGDDCDLETILNVFRQPWSQRDEDETEGATYNWIPSTIFNCGCFSDRVDTGMRSKVFQIIDEVLLKGLTPTAKAMAWAIIMDTSTDESFNFLRQMMQQRSNLQKALHNYLTARAKSFEYERDTDDRIEASSKAYECLENVASLSGLLSKASEEDVLEPLHVAKDKRIFRILATITNPADSANARKRALEKLPDLTKHLGSAASEWVTQLVTRCAMGDSLNSEVVQSCIVLAQECFEEEDVKVCKKFLDVVSFASSIFPELCHSSEAFESLTEMFSKCRTANAPIRKKLDEHGVVTMLSEILSSSAAMPASAESGISDFNKDNLASDLMQLCTREGTPEQARNAVYTLFNMIERDETEPQGQTAVSLLDSLTAPTKLLLSNSAKDTSKLVSVLASLSALSECSPQTFSSAKGANAVKFCLERILLGRNSDESGSEDSDESDAEKSAKKRSRSSLSKRRNRTPKSKGRILEDENISPICRRLCAAIDFLVSYVRSTNVAHKRFLAKQMNAPNVSLPDKQLVATLFEVFGQIVTDQGLPPSDKDRKACRSRTDRAALRQCAGISLIRLCDPRLGYEKELLSQSLWHTLGGTFLDEERVVRVAVMTELADLLSGSNFYGPTKSKLPAKSPSLRLLAYLVLCTDGEKDFDAGNGSSANVGSSMRNITQSAFTCVKTMRRLCDDFYTQCRAKGAKAEEKFETVFKMHIMPEYMVPYAYHLLAMRRETPSAEEYTSDLESENDSHRDSQLRHLTKRLKVVFDLLVLSLGDTADNISFLLRITEVLGNNYSPVDVSLPHSMSAASTESKRASILQAKLKIVCETARESLQAYIKQDVNLAPYVSGLQIPSTIFSTLHSIGTVVVPAKASLRSATGEISGPKRRPQRSSSPGKLRYQHSDESHDEGSKTADALDSDKSEDEAKPRLRSRKASLTKLRKPAAGEESESNDSTIVSSKMSHAVQTRRKAPADAGSASDSSAGEPAIANSPKTGQKTRATNAGSRNDNSKRARRTTKSSQRKLQARVETDSGSDGSDDDSVLLKSKKKGPVGKTSMASKHQGSESEAEDSDNESQPSSSSKENEMTRASKGKKERKLESVVFDEESNDEDRNAIAPLSDEESPQKSSTKRSKLSTSPTSNSLFERSTRSGKRRNQQDIDGIDEDNGGSPGSKSASRSGPSDHDESSESQTNVQSERKRHHSTDTKKTRSSKRFQAHAEGSSQGTGIVAGLSKEPPKKTFSMKSPPTSVKVRDGPNVVQERSPKVHFSPDLQIHRQLRNGNREKMSISPDSALYQESSIGGDTLVASPPSFVPTTSAPDPTSDESSPNSSRSSRRSQRIKSNSAAILNLSDDPALVAKSVPSVKESTVSFSQTTSLSSEAAASLGRKRAKQHKEDSRNAKKRTRKNPPKQIKVDKSAPETSPLGFQASRKLTQESDELDFNFDDDDMEVENNPSPRNRNKSKKAVERPGGRRRKMKV